MTTKKETNERPYKYGTPTVMIIDRVPGHRVEDVKYEIKKIKKEELEKEIKRRKKIGDA